jgi:hypothetical protein
MNEQVVEQAVEQEQAVQEAVVQEAAPAPATALIPELEDAISSDNPVAALKAYSTTDKALSGLLTIAHTLSEMLGATHPSTVAAIATLRQYKLKHTAKTKAFDAAAEVRKLVHAKDYAAMVTLSENTAVPEALRMQLVTVATLHKAGVPDAVLDIAVKTLRGMTQKGSGTRAPAAKFTTMFDGKGYDNLMDALEAAGWSKAIPEGENKSPATKAWNKVRKPLIKDGTATLDGKVFTKAEAQPA